MAAGAAVATGAPAPEEAAEEAAEEADERAALAPELAADWTLLMRLDREAPAEPVAVATSEVKLASSEEAEASMEETADEASLATELATEETWEPSEDWMEERADETPLAPGRTEETWPAMEEAAEEMRDSTWALATPATATRAMVEKRMLMVWWCWFWVDD